MIEEILDDILNVLIGLEEKSPESSLSVTRRDELWTIKQKMLNRSNQRLAKKTPKDTDLVDFIKGPYPVSDFHPHWADRTDG